MLYVYELHTLRHLLGVIKALADSCLCIIGYTSQLSSFVTRKFYYQSRPTIDHNIKMTASVVMLLNKECTHVYGIKCSWAMSET